MLWALVAPALAEVLRLEPSPGARLLPLAPLAEGRVDLLVHDNTADLRAQVEAAGDGLRAARALDLGGDWVVTVWVLDPNHTVAAEPDGAGWRLRAVPRVPTSPTVRPAPSLTELRRPGASFPGCAAPRLPLEPLPGAEARWGVEAGHAPLHLARWTEAEPDVADWAAVSRARAVLAAAPDDAARAVTLYRLGALHRDLGHAREAAYYFGEADRLGDEDAGLAALQRAGAFARARAWAPAVAAAWDAVDEGAPPEQALEVMGAAAVAGESSLPAVALGRALVASSPHPEAHLVGAALLTRAGCGVEAVDRLRAALPLLRGEPRQLARLLLVDALLVAGRPLEADDELAEVEVGALRPAWRGLARARSRLIPLLLEPPDAWLAALPGLTRSAASDSPEGDDALWVLGQVYEAVGEDPAAIDAWGRLVDRRHASGTAAPTRRLAQAWARRTAALLASQRLPEALDLHAAAWRPVLAEALDDPRPLVAVAEGYARAGLPRRALAVLRDVAAIEQRTGAPGHATALALARLYLELGDPGPALDTATWLRRQTRDRRDLAEVDLVAGRALLALGREGEARMTFERLAGLDSVGDRARASLVRLFAEEGDCARAASLVEGLGSDLPEDERAVAVRIVARCRASRGEGGPVDDPLLERVVREDAAHAAFLGRRTPHQGSPGGERAAVR